MCFSRSLRRPLEIGGLESEKGGKNTAGRLLSHQFKILQCWPSSAGLAQIMITRGAPVGHRNVMRFLSGCPGQGRVTRCTDLKNTQTTIKSDTQAPRQRSFPQDTNHFCATVGRSIGTVPDSGVKVHCSPESPRLVHQLARHFHSHLHRLVDARHHQEAPDTHSVRGAICLCL